MNRYISSFAIIACLAALALASNQNPQQPVIVVKPPTPGGPIIPGNTCPQPTPLLLNCMREWACQNLISLDLRCLLNLNGNPLLTNLLGSGGGDNNGGLLTNILTG